MRINSLDELDKHKKSTKGRGDDSGMANWASEQIRKALEETQGSKPRAKPKGSSRTVVGESKGEFSIRLALSSEFGWWDDGGELVQELMPFTGRRFRCDFALPRWRLSIECDGFTHHSKFLSDHHRDRVRGLYFSARDWLVFRVSHGMAINDPASLIDALRDATKIRVPVSRSAIQLKRRDYKTGTCFRLIHEI